MKKQNYSEMSTDELQKILKPLTSVTGILAGALTVLFAVSIFVFNKGMAALIVLPIALSTILFINFGKIKTIKKELKLREV
jgi:hypothetical protein